MTLILPDREARIELLYPTNTHVRLIDRVPRTPRQLIVHAVRDLVKEPLTPAEFLRRPYTARSRFLLRAWDENERSFRQFYLGSTDRFRAPGCLRLVIEDPDREPPMKVVSRGFEPTVVDRRVMVRTIAEWLRNQPDLADKLRVQADDMRMLA